MDPPGSDKLSVRGNENPNPCDPKPVLGTGTSATTINLEEMPPDPLHWLEFSQQLREMVSFSTARDDSFANDVTIPESDPKEDASRANSVNISLSVVSASGDEEPVAPAQHQRLDMTSQSRISNYLELLDSSNWALEECQSPKSNVERVIRKINLCEGDDRCVDEEESPAGGDPFAQIKPAENGELPISQFVEVLERLGEEAKSNDQAELEEGGYAESVLESLGSQTMRCSQDPGASATNLGGSQAPETQFNDKLTQIDGCEDIDLPRNAPTGAELEGETSNTNADIACGTTLAESTPGAPAAEAECQQKHAENASAIVTVQPNTEKDELSEPCLVISSSSTSAAGSSKSEVIPMQQNQVLLEPRQNIQNDLKELGTDRGATVQEKTENDETCTEEVPKEALQAGNVLSSSSDIATTECQPIQTAVETGLPNMNEPNAEPPLERALQSTEDTTAASQSLPSPVETFPVVPINSDFPTQKNSAMEVRPKLLPFVVLTKLSQEIHAAAIESTPHDPASPKDDDSTFGKLDLDVSTEVSCIKRAIQRALQETVDGITETPPEEQQQQAQESNGSVNTAETVILLMETTNEVQQAVQDSHDATSSVPMEKLPSEQVAPQAPKQTDGSPGNSLDENDPLGNEHLTWTESVTSTSGSDPSSLLGHQKQRETVEVEPGAQTPRRELRPRTLLKRASVTINAGTQTPDLLPPAKQVRFAETPTILNGSGDSVESNPAVKARPPSTPFVYRTRRSLQMEEEASDDPIDLTQDDGDSTFESLFPQQTSTPKPGAREQSTALQDKPDESSDSLKNDINFILQKTAESFRPNPAKPKKAKRLVDFDRIRSELRKIVQSEFVRFTRKRRSKMTPKPKTVIIRKIVKPRPKPVATVGTQTTTKKRATKAIQTIEPALPSTETVATQTATTKRGRAAAGPKANDQPAAKRVRKPVTRKKPPPEKEAAEDRAPGDEKVEPMRTRQRQQTLSQCLTSVNSTDKECQVAIVEGTSTAADNVVIGENSKQKEDTMTLALTITKGCYRSPLVVFQTQNSSERSSQQTRSPSVTPFNNSTANVGDLERMNSFYDRIDRLRFSDQSECDVDDEVISNSQGTPRRPRGRKWSAPAQKRRLESPNYNAGRLGSYPSRPVIQKPSDKLVRPVTSCSVQHVVEPDEELSLLEPLAIGPIDDPELFMDDYVEYIGKRYIQDYLGRRLPSLADMYGEPALHNVWDIQCETIPKLRQGSTGQQLNVSVQSATDQKEKDEEEDGFIEEDSDEAETSAVRTDKMPFCSSIRSSQEPRRFSPGLSTIECCVESDEDSGPLVPQFW